MRYKIILVAAVILMAVLLRELKGDTNEEESDGSADKYGDAG